MDILTNIYELIKDDDFMQQHVDNRYMFSEFPDAQTITTSYITINPVVPGEPAAYADGKRIADTQSARVDVFVRASDLVEDNPRTLCHEIMERIADILDDNYYAQTASFTPEYDKDHKLYRESRSFQTNYYRSDY